MKRFAFVFFFFLFLLLSISVSAHPGRTDEDGGHYDQSTGKYHWHHGYEAHQHYDMDNDGDIDCPYDFDNKYDQTGGLQGGKSKVEFNTTESSSDETKGNQTGRDEEVNWFVAVSPFIAVIAIAIVLVLSWKISKKNEELEKLNALMKSNERAMAEEGSKYRHLLISHGDKERQLQEEIDKLKIEHESQERKLQFDIEELKAQLLKENGFTKQYFLEKFGEDIQSVMGKSNGDYIGEDGLPAYDDFSGTQWGMKYTRLVTKSTQKYHMDGCRYAWNAREVHVLDILKMQGVSPCKVCNPYIPDMKWFFEGRVLTKFIDSFFVDKDDVIDEGSEEDQDLQ